MNHEPSQGSKNQHPVFNQPLTELQFTTARDRIYQIGNDDDHVLRVEALYESSHEALMCSSAARIELDELKEKFDVHSVPYSSVIANDAEEVLTLYQVAERVKDAFPVSELKEIGTIGESVANEIDRTATGLALHIKDVLENGGILNPEFTRLNQFVISPSRPETQRLVLVDITPTFPRVLTKPEHRNQDGSDDVVAASAFSALIKSYIGIRNISTHSFDADAALREAIAAIKGSAPEITRLKNDLLQAVDTGDIQTLCNIDAIEGDEDDDENVDDPYLSRFAGSTQTYYPGSFKTMESLKSFIQTGER